MHLQDLHPLCSYYANCILSDSESWHIWHTFLFLCLLFSSFTEHGDDVYCASLVS